MKRILHSTSLMLIAFFSSTILFSLDMACAAAQEEPNNSAPVTDQASPTQTADADDSNATKPPMTAEQKAEAEAAKAEFDALRNKLADALLEMRTTYIHYQNNEDQSIDAQNRYRQQRDRVRELMREVYDAADRLMIHQFDKEALTYIGTTIEHREKNDIYDESTLSGSTQLIDGGARELFLFLAAARSAVSVGKVDLAKRIYETVNEDQIEDIDKSLMYQLDKIKEQWEAEVQRRESDAKKELPRVRLETTRGNVVVELFLDSAPSTVAHFIGLVEDGFYDGLDFYQVMDHMLALTGDPSGDGRGNSGQFLLDEHERDDARHGVRGSLIMAKIPIADTGKFVPNSASSQFAILFLPVTTVSGHQTVFGRVIEGMDVISSLRRVDPAEKDKEKKVIIPPDRILSAEVIRRSDELPQPQYLDLKEALSEAQRQLQNGQSPTAAP